MGKKAYEQARQLNTYQSQYFFRFCLHFTFFQEDEEGGEGKEDEAIEEEEKEREDEGEEKGKEDKKGERSIPPSSLPPNFITNEGSQVRGQGGSVVRNKVS